MVGRLSLYKLEAAPTSHIISSQLKAMIHMALKFIFNMGKPGADKSSRNGE